MCRLETTFEIGQSLHIPSCVLARHRIDCPLSAQVSNSASEETFGRAHHQKRKVRDIVPKTHRKAMHLIEKERTEVDVRENKCKTDDLLIEARAHTSEDTYAATLLVSNKYKEAREKHERRENKEEIRHSD